MLPFNLLTISMIWILNMWFVFKLAHLAISKVAQTATIILASTARDTLLTSNINRWRTIARNTTATVAQGDELDQTVSKRWTSSVQ